MTIIIERISENNWRITDADTGRIVDGTPKFFSASAARAYAASNGYRVIDIIG